MEDENNQQQEPTVTQTGGTQGVQFSGDPEGRAQEEANRNNQQQAPAQRPEGLPDGFDTWEAYGQAVSKGEINPDGTKKEAAEEQAQAADLSAEQQAQVDAALQDLPEANREKAQPFFEEFARSGALSDDSVKAAAEAFGVSEAMVRQYVSGAQAEDVAQATTIVEAAGTDMATFQAFQQWANEGGYTAEQTQAFNDALAKDGPQAVRDAIQAWKESGNGPAPRDITKGERPVPAQNQQGPEAYASIAEMQRDMNDPRYAKDPAFRAKVEGRVGASDFNIGRKTR